MNSNLNSLNMVGCRPLRLRPEAFVSATVGDVLWKSKMNGEVCDELQCAIRMAMQG